MGGTLVVIAGRGTGVEVMGPEVVMCYVKYPV